MANTKNLGITYLAQNQANKEITINEALLRIDSLLNSGAKSKATNTPPTSPLEGDLYIVPTGATGAWSGKTNKITYYHASKGWVFVTPNEGVTLWVNDENKIYSFDGATWVATMQLESASKLGVNATADNTNKLAVKSDAVLFDNNGGDSKVKVNKAAVGNTASHLFQNNYSGRAELGLTGDDDFRIKVSADGSSWVEAALIDKTTGGFSHKTKTHFSTGTNTVKINDLNSYPLEIYDSTPTRVASISDTGFLNIKGSYSATTALAANMYINSAGGVFRSTSSAKYKHEIEDISIERAKKLLQFRPVKYKSNSENDNPNYTYYGLIAEEVAEIDPRLVYYNESGEPEGVQYDRLVVLIIKILQTMMKDV